MSGCKNSPSDNSGWSLSIISAIQGNLDPRGLSVCYFKMADAPKITLVNADVPCYQRLQDFSSIYHVSAASNGVMVASQVSIYVYQESITHLENSEHRDPCDQGCDEACNSLKKTLIGGKRTFSWQSSKTWYFSFENSLLADRLSWNLIFQTSIQIFNWQSQPSYYFNYRSQLLADSLS